MIDKIKNLLTRDDKNVHVLGYVFANGFGTIIVEDNAKLQSSTLMLELAETAEMIEFDVYTPTSYAEVFATKKLDYFRKCCELNSENSETFGTFNFDVFRVFSAHCSFDIFKDKDYRRIFILLSLEYKHNSANVSHTFVSFIIKQMIVEQMRPVTFEFFEKFYTETLGVPLCDNFMLSAYDNSEKHVKARQIASELIAERLYMWHNR